MNAAENDREFTWWWVTEPAPTQTEGNSYGKWINVCGC